MCPRRALFLAALALSAGVTPALAVDRTASDGAGNTIHFQVDAPSATITDEVDALRRAPHGAEINNVIIRIVPDASVTVACGSAAAAGCYNWESGSIPRITVPDLPAGEPADVLLHEYGHHVDASISNGSLPEPNGTRTWWTQRKMATLLSQGLVARDYSLGWDKSIGEIFAEDYAQLTVAAPYGIDWLGFPDTSILSALRQDIVDAGGSAGTGAAPGVDPVPPTANAGAAPASGVSRAPASQLSPRKRGTLSRRKSFRLPFTTAGQTNRITVSVRGRGRMTSRTLRAVLQCRGQRLAAKWVRPGRTTGLRARVAGTSRCVARVTNVRGGNAGYDIRVRVTSWP